MTPRVSFHVPGCPVPRARPRIAVGKNGSRRTYTPKSTVAWQQLVGQIAVMACARTRGLRAALLAGPQYRVTVRMVFPDHRTRDPDGVLASVLDAMVRAGILANDCSRNIAELHVYSRIENGAAGTDVELEVMP